MTEQQNMAKAQADAAVARAKAATARAKAARGTANAMQAKTVRAKARLDKVRRVDIKVLNVIRAYAREIKSGKAAFEGWVTDAKTGICYRVTGMAVS